MVILLLLIIINIKNNNIIIKCNMVILYGKIVVNTLEYLDRIYLRWILLKTVHNNIVQLFNF